MPLDFIFQCGIRSTGSVPSGLTYYVNASTGNDSRTPTQAQNPSTPWLTINHALSEVGFGAGDGADITVSVAPGTYVEALSDLPGGSSGHHFILRSSTPLGAIIAPGSGSIQVVTFARNYVTFEGFVVDGNGVNANNVVVNDGVSDIIIQDNEVKNTEVGDDAGPGSFQAIFSGGDNILIYRNVIHDVGVGAVNGFNHGMYLLGVTNNIVDGNTVYEIGANGIQIFGGTNTGNTIKNNRIYNWARTTAGVGNAIYVEGDSTLVFNNLGYQTAFNSQSYGMTISGSSNEVYNNTLNQIANEGINLVGSSTVRNNLLYTIGGTPINVVSGSHTINTNLEDSVDPLFVNAGTGDFHLQSGSPARNTGATIGAVTVDIAGTSRPQESIYEIGAYEYVP